MKTLGQRISEQRQKLGMTQEELAKKVGVQRQTIYKWEKGIVKYINRARLDDLAYNVFHCDPKWLLGYDDNDTVTVTYEAPGKEPVTLLVDDESKPIIGTASKRAQLVKAALAVAPENIDIALEVLKTFSAPE